MTHANFNREFINKFRQEYISYPGVEEQQYQHFLFRQFTGIGNEIPLLGNWLSEKTNDPEINSYLIDKLKTKDLRSSGRLLRFVKNFNKFLSSSAQKEPYTAHYYHLLLADLNPFLSLISSFREKIQLNLLGKLHARSSANANTDNAAGNFNKELDNTVAELEEYTCQIWKYYDYFNFLLKEESANNRGIALLSQVEEYLFGLISLIEKLLIATEFTQSALVNWQTKLTDLEKQELYN